MKIPKKPNKEELSIFEKNFFLDKKKYHNKNNFYSPVTLDLYYLYHIIILNKRFNILEFGTGFSTLILSHALKLNKSLYKNINFNKFGIDNPFNLFVVDDQKKYLKISRNRFDNYKNSKYVKPKFLFTTCKLKLINNQICNEYAILPNFIPDFIYIDGPDTNMITNSINGLNISKNKNLMPMSSDVLKIENYLSPGTIIAIDGRYHNAIFLKNNLKRKWKYKYNQYSDQHFFYLNELTDIGKKSKLLLNFYKY